MGRHDTDAFPSTLGFVVRAALGSCIVTALMLVSPRGKSPIEQLGDRGVAVLWITLVAAQGAFWFSVTGYAWRLARGYVPQRRDVRHVAPSLAVLLLLLVGVPLAARIGGERLNPLWGAVWKMPLLAAIAFVTVAFPSFVGILGIQASALRRTATQPQDGDIDWYVQVRDDLNRFLMLLGGGIGLAVLALGALRNAVLASNPRAAFPPEAVLEYGAFLTILVVFAYAPAHQAVGRLGTRIRDGLLPGRPAVGSHDFGEWYASRTLLTDLLQLDVGIYQRLQTAVFVLAPMLSAALSLTIPKAP